jgi:maleate isomerase
MKLHGPKILGTITPSGNTVVEAVTQAALRDVPGVLPIFARIPVHGTRDPFPESYDLEGMLSAAELLSHAKPDVILWNGSKGGAIGLDHDRDLARRITAATGIPATTSGLALEAALAARGPVRIGLLTPYNDAYQAKLIAAFAARGWVVSAEDHLGLSDNLSYAGTPREEIAAQAERLAPRCDLLLGWCTNYPVPLIGEEYAGKPVWDATLLGLRAALKMIGA